MGSILYTPKIFIHQQMWILAARNANLCSRSTFQAENAQLDSLPQASMKLIYSFRQVYLVSFLFQKASNDQQFRYYIFLWHLI